MDEHLHHGGRSDGAYVIAASFVLAAIIVSASVIYAFNGVNSSLAQISTGMADIKAGMANIKVNPALAGATPTPAPAAPTAPAAQPGGKISLTGAAALGSANAKVYLAEYSDFQCPFCGRHVTQTEGDIIKDYVETGKVKLLFKEFPLDQIHPNARPAANAFECARDQNETMAWMLHAKFFANQESLTAANLKTWAKEVGLDPAKFDPCLNSSAKNSAIDAMQAEGSANGIQGTPGFLITDAAGNVLDRISGAYPYAAFQQKLDAALAA